MLIIFTDLDGTLLNQHDYSYEAALPMIQHLKSKDIPIIPVTSKTRKEVQALRDAIQLKDPFITENGSGIFIEITDQRFEQTKLPSSNELSLIRLGCTYSEARQGLQELSNELGIVLKGFGDMSVKEVEAITGLSEQEAADAQTRDFTEPFITPSEVSADEIKTSAQKLGFKITVGDRFSHLIGKHTSKGEAVKKLLQISQRKSFEQSIVTVGLGNSPNDLEMLEAVNIPIVIPGDSGAHPLLAKQSWKVAAYPGAKGWANAIASLNKYL